MPHVPFSAGQNGSLTPLGGLLSSSISQTRELKERKGGGGGEMKDMEEFVGSLDRDG